MHKPFDTATKHLLEADPPGRLAALPLAPIADVAPEQLPEVIMRMEYRIDTETEPGERGSLWTAAYLLMGLRYERRLIHRLLKGVRGMKESTTYQEILEEGEAKGIEKGIERGKTAEARALLLRIGSKRFGAPEAQIQATIEAITSLEELERLADRLLETETWQELLQEP